MISGNIVNLKKHIDADKAKLIASFIENLNLDTAKIGEWIFLSSDLKVLLLDKSNFTEGVFEAHKIYKDAHIVIKGSDTVVFANQQLSKETKAYDNELDYTLYSSKELFKVKLLPESFVLIDENEQHSNQISDSQTLKLVAKIK